MPSPWSSFAASSAALALLLATPAPADAATVLRKHVRHEIDAQGSVTETVRLRVRIDDPADRDAWGAYDIYLDEHRELEDVSARVVSPGGDVRELKKKDQDVHEVSEGFALHTSTRFHRLTFPALPLGAVVEIESKVVARPYFPGGAIALVEPGDTLASLTVELAGEPVSWQVSGPPVELRREESGGVLRWVGEGIESPTPPDLAPSDAAVPHLRYRWGDGVATWAGVGRWYDDLVADLPPPSPAVAARARELTRGLESPRDRLEALLAEARGPVRYVAVEVGVGGYRPTPPGETLERGWGDCKDKAMLLVEMLREVGVDAYPALILLDSDGRVDPEFASGQVFNHMIVAVSADGLEAAPTDPVADGLLFVDPTHEKGDSRWLHGGVQDQNALVLRPPSEGGARLVTTPLLAADNRRVLELDLTVDAAGRAVGTARVTLSGVYGSWLEEAMESAHTDRMEEMLRGLFSSLLPGVGVGDLGWGMEETGAVPTAVLHGNVSVAGLVPGSGARRSFQLPGLGQVPEASLVEGREVPVVLLPGVTEERWTIELPGAGCASATDDVDAETAVGSFAQDLAVDGRTLTVERKLAWNERWIEPEGFDAFREVALEARRARLRRLRLDCSGSERPTG